MRNEFYNRVLALAAILGLLGVVFGAFGAHFLKTKLEPSSLEIIKTGVLYLFIHVLACLFVVIMASKDEVSRILKSSGILFLAGILLFSGSLFLIGTQSLTGLNVSFIGILTPLGGICFISGWLMLTLYAFSNR